MKKRKSESGAKRIENPPFFILVTLALIISLTAGLVGLFSAKKDAGDEVEKNSSLVEKSDQEESVGELFDDEFESGESQYITDEFSVNDPFVEACASTAGDNLPSVVDGTVCLR